MAATIQALVPRMRDICGAGNVITDPLELRTYECDGLTCRAARSRGGPLLGGHSSFS